MKYLLLFLALLVAYSPSGANGQFKVLGEGPMNWPGIHYQIFWLSRIQPDRLVVGVRMLATPQAPAQTLVGYPVPVPHGLTPEQIAAGDYRPLPFSLAPSIMIDDISKQQYPTLPSISPPGRAYYSNQVVGTLAPGQTLLFTVQFKIPPPPPPPEPGQPPVKQTLSFLFTNAKSPIKNIPIPPPIPPAPSATP